MVEVASNTIPVAAADFLPHSHPILMLGEIVALDDVLKASVLQTTISRSNPFVFEDGVLLPSAYLELISQGAAAQHGFNLRRLDAVEEMGFLVGVRNFNIHDTARVGDVLTINVHLGTEIESLSVVYGSVERGGKSLADAEITVWHGQAPSKIQKS